MPEGVDAREQRWTLVVCPSCEVGVMPAGACRTRCACGTYFSVEDERLEDRDRYPVWWEARKHRYPTPGRRIEAVPASRLAEVERERDRLRMVFGETCPDAEVCKTCPCSDEDDVSFPGERLRAELERAREALEEAANDLDKAANQFAGIRASQDAGNVVRVVVNPEAFAEKAARARSAALDAIGPATRGKTDG